MNMSLQRSLYALISVALLLAAWWFSSAGGWVSEFVLPPPWEVYSALVRLATGYMGTGLWAHFSASMLVVLSGYIAAVLIGVPLGMAMALSPLADKLIGPLVMVLRPIPPPAWIPLAILWFGIGLSGKVFVVFVAAIVPCLLNAYIAARETPPKLIDAARMLGASRATVIRDVVIPSSIPVVLTGIRIALGNAWATLVAAELVAATAGFGFLVINGYRNFESSIMAAAMIMIAVIGAIMNLMFLAAERYIVRWQRSAE